VWEREVANVRIHGTTGEAPIARFERAEAHRLKPLSGRPSFGSLRELTRVVGNDCAVEIDTNSYSVPWRLIGERVAGTAEPRPSHPGSINSGASNGSSMTSHRSAGQTGAGLSRPLHPPHYHR